MNPPQVLLKVSTLLLIIHLLMPNTQALKKGWRIYRQFKSVKRSLNFEMSKLENFKDQFINMARKETKWNAPMTNLEAERAILSL